MAKVTSLTLALLQMDSREESPSANRERVREAAREARERGADLLALPELWGTGYDLAQGVERGADNDSDFELLAELSREHDLALLGGSLLGKEGAGYCNTAVAYEAGKERSRYQKLHLFGPLGEDRHLRPGGRGPEAFDLRGMRCGLVVCYDLRFPAVFSHLARQGVDLVHVPAQWPEARIHHWRALLVARAIESQCYVVGVNRCGTFGETRFGGNSLVVSPDGVILLEAGSELGLFFTPLDPSAPRRQQESFPYSRDSRFEWRLRDGERSGG